MKLEKSVERQTKNTIEYYKNLDNLEKVPIDILRIMYKDLQEKYIDLENQYNDLDNCYGELEKDNSFLVDRIEELQYTKPDDKTMILDIELFKEKLRLYDLYSEELLNFIDDYMRLYNEE